MCRETLKKVIGWRIISLATSSLLAWPFMDSYTHSLGVSLVLNPAMLCVHYVFERFWKSKFETSSPTPLMATYKKSLIERQEALAGFDSRWRTNRFREE